MSTSPYSINLDTRFQPLEHMDIKALADAQTPWWNQTLTAVNDCVVRLGVVHGDFHWHKHDEEDEFFFVLEGQAEFYLDGERRTVGPQTSLYAPSWHEHGIRNTGDTELRYLVIKKYPPQPGALVP